MTQNNLGNVLDNHGTRTGGEEGKELIPGHQRLRDGFTDKDKRHVPGAIGSDNG